MRQILDLPFELPPGLTAPEVRFLAGCITHDYKKDWARQELLDGFQKRIAKMVHTVMKKGNPYGVDPNDLFQAAMLALTGAIDKLNNHHTAVGYLNKSVWNAIIKERKGDRSGGLTKKSKK